MQTKEYQKDTSLLRPFDLEAAKNGELLICTHDFTGREYVAGPDNSGRIIVKDNYGEFQLSQYYNDHYRMKPLAWCEGKPVYKGDVLYWNNYRGYKFVVGDGIIYDTIIKGLTYDVSGELLYGEEGNSGVTANDLTWSKPKQKVKRKVWINVYPEDDTNDCCCAYWDKNAADRAAYHERIACVETEIEYEV